MSNIRSVLIKTCMANIQKEISQLENWLITLPDDIPRNDSPKDTDIKQYLNALTFNVGVLTEKIESQEETLNEIRTRLECIENMKNIRVDDPWIDNDISPLLQNEIIQLSDSDNESDDIIYEVHKQADSITPITNKCINIPITPPVTPEIIPNIPDDKSCVPDIEDDQMTLDNQEEVEQEEEVEVEVEVEQEVEVEVKQEEEEVEQEEEVDQEEVDQEEEEEAEQEEEEVEVEEAEQEEEVEEQEEEEEGIELEEIEYNNKTYFKDNEGFIYSVIDGEPSENPIGYWKEKNNSIAFYKTK